jgi:hypothetical protein
MEVQSFLDHLIALVLCLFEHFRASLGELALGNFVVRILSPQPASRVSRFLPRHQPKKLAHAALCALPPVSNTSTIASNFAIFTENLSSVFEKFPF